MSGPKHTPGPWLRDGMTVYALTHYGWHKGEEVFANRFTASVMRGHECSGDEIEATARLIAAAPDLLESLDGVLHFLERGRSLLEQNLYSSDTARDLLDVAIHNARAAIAKAKGEA